MAGPEEVISELVCLGKTERRYHGSVLYVFVCPFCSSEFETTRHRAKKSGNCGCQKSIRLSQAGAGRSPINKMNDKDATVSSLYAACRTSARTKGFDMTLTRPEIAELIFEPCHYCGKEPELIRKVGAGVWVRDGVAANGIDRKDSSLGYVQGNVLPCCSDCNYLKSGRSYEDFVAKVRAIAFHLNDVTP